MDLKVEIVSPESRSLADLDEHVLAVCRFGEGNAGTRCRIGNCVYQLDLVPGRQPNECEVVKVLGQSEKPAEPRRTLKDLEPWTWAICLYDNNEMLRCHDGHRHVWGLDDGGVPVQRNRLSNVLDKYKVIRIIGQIRHKAMKEMEKETCGT